ncbi:hypothetical protein MKL26_06850 [Streptococcus suis]|nr:hypothetical protein [Streptococcus suis]
MTDNIPDLERKQNHYLKSYEVIASSFKESPMTVGIDKITLIFDAEVLVDKNKLNNYRIKKSKNIVINSMFFVQGKVNNITFKDSEIGKITISGNNINKEGQCQCTFELINGSLNVKTSQLSEIKERLFNALIEIESQSGIQIKIKLFSDIVIKSIELAFTFTSKNRIPLFTRLLLHKCLSNHEQPDKKVYSIKDDKLDHHIICSTEGYNLSFVTYDKTAKCENDGYLEENVERGFRLYRFEITLKKSNVKKFLETDELFKLKTENIHSYLRNTIKNGFNNLIKEINHSVIETDKLLEKVYFESNQNDYIEQFFLELLRLPMENVTTILLDEEIILYLKLTYLKNKSNRSRTIDYILTKIMKRSNFGDYPLSIMSTWQTLFLLKFMNQSLEKGDESNKQSSNLFEDFIFKAINLRQYPNEKRKELYDEIRKNRTKSTTINSLYRKRWDELDTSRITITITPEKK